MPGLRHRPDRHGYPGRHPADQDCGLCGWSITWQASLNPEGSRHENGAHTHHNHSSGSGTWLAISW